MQRFFHDIVDQLQNISLRSPNLNEGPLGSPTPSLDGRFSVPAPPSTPMIEDAPQFEDAEEEEGARQVRNIPPVSPLAASSSRDGNDFVIVADASVVPTAPAFAKPRPLSMIRPPKPAAGSQIRPPLGARSTGYRPSSIIGGRRVASGGSQGSDKENSAGKRASRTVPDKRPFGLALVNEDTQEPYDPSETRSTKILRKGKGASASEWLAVASLT